MGLFEKRRARKFFIYVQDYEDNDPKSHEGLDLNKVTARDLISYFLATFPFSYFISAPLILSAEQIFTLFFCFFLLLISSYPL